jgi:hypothetical protein
MQLLCGKARTSLNVLSNSETIEEVFVFNRISNKKEKKVLPYVG